MALSHLIYVEEGAFSDVLGLISRLGGKWKQKALTLQALDKAGVTNVDDQKVRSLNWAERLAGTPNSAVAMTDGGKHFPTLKASPFFVQSLGRGLP